VRGAVAFIDASLADPALSVSRVAAHVQLSTVAAAPVDACIPGCDAEGVHRAGTIVTGTTTDSQLVATP
jgi:hypothetical protein